MNYWQNTLLFILYVILAFVSKDISILVGISLAFIFGWYIIKGTIEIIRGKLR